MDEYKIWLVSFGTYLNAVHVDLPQNMEFHEILSENKCLQPQTHDECK